MLETFKNAWKVLEIRKKILFTLAIVVIYRIGCAIPVPGVDVSVVADSVQQNSFFGLFNVLTGGAFEQFAIFALGISPNINASIIIQLLTMVIPALERWSKEGEKKKKKISALTRYATLKTGNFLRVGRVIVPIVKAIYDRDMSIENFVPDIYYTLCSKTEIDSCPIELTSKQKFDKKLTGLYFFSCVSIRKRV